MDTPCIPSSCPSCPYRHDPLYARLATQTLYMEALPRRSSDYSSNGSMNGTVTAAMTFEEPVAATLLQIDRRRDDDSGYLGLLHCANDEETLERLLAKAFEHVAEQGCGLPARPHWRLSRLESGRPRQPL